MAKNNAFINSQKRAIKQSLDVVPKVYAAIAIVLQRKLGWDFEDISFLFNESQKVWNECATSGADMLKMCYEETGIDMTRRVNERQPMQK